jgi:hypothetical protein
MSWPCVCRNKVTGAAGDDATSQSGNARLVAQIFNLLYRGFSLRQLSEAARVAGFESGQPIGNRRYSRFKICATLNRFFNLTRMCTGCRWVTGPGIPQKRGELPHRS